MKKKFSYAESIEICEKVLDMIPIQTYLGLGLEPNDIMWDIECDLHAGIKDGRTLPIYIYMLDYPEIFGDDPPELFNYMTDVEFMTYCQKRFPEIKWGHETIERYWVHGINS